MKKEKRTLQQELNIRKFKKPNRFLYFIYYFVMAVVTSKRYHPTFKWTDDVRKTKGPAFIIWNHQSRLDHMFIMKMCYPRRTNMLAGYNEFFRSHLHWAFKMINILPKKMYTNDLISIKAIGSIIKQGGLIPFSPEGTSSIFGDNQPIVPGTGKFLKHYGIPVYFVEFHGAYLTNHKVCLDERYGKIECEMKLLFSPEDLKNMSGDEIQDKINDAFHHDDYEWNKKEHIKYQTNGNIASHYSDMLYKCPKCGEEFSISSEKDIIKCEKCGNGTTLDEFYDFHPFNKDCVIPETPTKWVLYERKCIIDEIRANPNYSWTFKVKLGYLPPDHYVKDKKVSEMCGEGEFTIDHNGVHYKGTKLGETFNFDLDYHAVYTVPIVTDVTTFSLFVDGNFYEFIPSKPIVGKVILLVQEMHRFHVNEWKNFKWLDNLYN